MRIVAIGLLVGSCSLVPGTDAHMTKIARDVLSDGLFDASSAEFRRLREIKGKDGNTAICGEVNAKNRLGAYVGFRRFLASPSDRFSIVDPQSRVTDARTPAEVEEQATQAGFDEVWKSCV